MLKINKKITPYNFTHLDNKRNMWIVIHYVGAVSTAKANANYFYNAKRGASANYFVDENEIWQVVEDTDAAWHVGANKYYNSCRNNNSIGIEMCCKKNGSKWYFENQTIKNTLELTRMLMKKYNIPIERVCRHYDVTMKICPEPFVRDEKAWQKFLDDLKKEETKEVLTLDEALFFLHDKGLLDKTEHWKYMSENVKDLQFVFIKWANSLSEYKAQD